MSGNPLKKGISTITDTVGLTNTAAAERAAREAKAERERMERELTAQQEAMKLQGQAKDNVAVVEAGGSADSLDALGLGTGKKKKTASVGTTLGLM